MTRSPVVRLRGGDAQDSATVCVIRLLPDGRPDPAGVCQLRYRLSVWTASHDCWLEDLYVTDEARGTGDDMLKGCVVNDTLNGVSVEDPLNGGAGDDSLNGGTEDDEIGRAHV